MPESKKSKANNRYERKFVVKNLSKPGIEQIVKNHPAAFSEIFHERNVNNIYLDTPDLTYFFENVIGKSNRKKVRLRWYGELFGEIKSPVLEFKFKKGMVGNKLLFVLKPFILDLNFNIDVLKSIFARSELPEWVLHDILPLEPHLLNRYTRKYFRSFDKNFRVTVDNNMIYQDISRRNNSFTKRSVNDTDIIVELKYNFDKDDLANTITNHFPFRITKSSKYVNGIQQFKQGIAI